MSQGSQAVPALLLRLDALPLRADTAAVAAVPEYGHSAWQSSPWDPARAAPRQPVYGVFVLLPGQAGTRLLSKSARCHEVM